jgi:hypothetical protein
MSENVIDLGTMEAASVSEYLKPGMYRLKVDAEGTKVYTPEGKTAYLAIKFVSEKYGSLTEKFFLTSKAIPRLLHLHEAWFGKKCVYKASSYKDIGDYFKQALTAKIVTRPMMTGGKITADGKFYAGLPYTGFVIADEGQFEEGVFEEDSARYKQVVKIEKVNPLVAASNDTILPSSDASGGYKPLDDKQMPW